MLRRRARAQHRRHRRIVAGLALGRDEIEREALRPRAGIDVELDAIGLAQGKSAVIGEEFESRNNPGRWWRARCPGRSRQDRPRRKRPSPFCRLSGGSSDAGFGQSISEAMLRVDASPWAATIVGAALARHRRAAARGSRARRGWPRPTPPPAAHRAGRRCRRGRNCNPRCRRGRPADSRNTGTSAGPAISGMAAKLLRRRRRARRALGLGVHRHEMAVVAVAGAVLDARHRTIPRSAPACRRSSARNPSKK